MMDQSPLISIIVPVYNVREYLERCVDSILAQTHTNIEVFLVDDGSTDGGGEICDEYAASDNRVKVIHQSNAGISAARNAGLNAAKGDWVGLVDSDDWIEPNMFEELLKSALESGNQIVVCGLSSHLLNGKVTTSVLKGMEGTMPRLEALGHIMRSRYFSSVWCALYSRKMLEAGNPLRFDECIYHAEDNLFLAEAFNKSDGIFILAKALYHYCLREGSLTQTLTEKRLTSIDAKAREIELVSPISEELGRYARCRYMECAVFLMNLSVREKKYEYLPKLKKAARRYLFIYLTAKEPNLPQKFRNVSVTFFPKVSNWIWEASRKRLGLKRLTRKLKKR